MTKKLSLVSHGFIRRKDLDFSDDGSRFIGYEYAGLPISYCKYKDYYYLSIKVDEDNHKFNWYDWRNAPEYKLTNEFNGCKEVNVEKLKDNCIKINKAIERLNKAADEDIVDPYELAHIVQLEILARDEVLNKIKNDFKWYNASPDDLKTFKYYFDDIKDECLKAKDFYNDLISDKFSKYMLRFFRSKYNDCNYLKLDPEDWQIKKLVEIMKKAN